MATPLTAAIEKSELFNVFSTSYKTINDHAIGVDVQISKNIKPGKHPLLVRFHGGGLITGASLFMGMYAPWIMDYAIAYEAIIVSPNHRLLPESTGLDIMKDLSDFWHWTQSELPAFVSSRAGGVEVDLSRTLVQGESSGGYLALQSGLNQPSRNIKAVVASFPMVDLKSPWFTQCFEKSLYGLPMLPADVLDDHLTRMRPGEIVSRADFPDRRDLMFATVQRGRFLEFLGHDTSLFPLETIGSAESFPPLFIYHGQDDSIVPVQGTVKFVEKFRQMLPEAKLVFKIEPGEHGMDHQTDIKEPWLQEGLELITYAWLS